MQLRWYQQEAHAATMTELFSPNPRNSLVLMPTGTGKSVQIAVLCCDILHYVPNARIVAFAHVQELIEQNAEKLRSMWPTAALGIWSAGLNSYEFNQQITFATIATAVKNVAALGRRDIILIDEVHRLSPKSMTMYAQVIEALLLLNPKLIVIGYTATGYREGHGMITQPYVDRKTGTSHPSLFSHVAYDLTDPDLFVRLIKEGFLAPLVPRPTTEYIDVSNVPLRGNEYVQADVEKITNTPKKIQDVVNEIIMNGVERRSWLVFAAGNANAELLAAEIKRRGFTAAVVNQKTPKAVRKQYIADFKAGKLRALVNNDVLTTGFDYPQLDLIAVVRATNSTSLWVQILGRGTRPAYELGKQNCLVLDFARNTERLGTINRPNIPPSPSERKKKGGEIPVRVCDKCGTYNHVSAKVCEYCGADFPVTDNVERAASTLELISSNEPIIKDYTVTRVFYELFSGNGDKSLIKVTYGCGRSMQFVEFIDPSTNKGREWWKLRSSAPMPPSAGQVVSQSSHLRQPLQIEVWMNKPNAKYPIILKHKFDASADNDIVDTDSFTAAVDAFKLAREAAL